ncbi:hypothetical protein SAMD00023353_7000390 [Rosellinia necatrix]|uniref:Uncharacterized protein n=1 Tax=Rosellinia necatrix TaxID=77044 RepID=A0A1S8AAK5_ROSNE|nr:hypothetical protein SAMD00023353_7000390 [Rosellinia necatrix]
MDKPPVIPPRGASHKAPTKYGQDPSRDSQENLSEANLSSQNRQSPPMAIAGIGSSQTTQGNSRRGPKLTIDTNIAAQPHISRRAPEEIDSDFKARAPWAEPDAFIPRPSHHSLAPTCNQRSTTGARNSKFIENLDEEPKSVSGSLSELPRVNFFRVIGNLAKGSVRLLNISKKGPKATTRGSAKNFFRGPTDLRKEENRDSAQDNPPSQYTLTANAQGVIPLLTLQRKRRHLEISDPPLNVLLDDAKAALRTIGDAFTRDPPELELPRGQAQIDIVAGYLRRPCGRGLEESPTTQFVRHSLDSLQAWDAYLNPNPNPNPGDRARAGAGAGTDGESDDSDANGDARARARALARRWNMVEARRRVRAHNTVIEDFNRRWDAWVGEQGGGVRAAARRHPGREAIARAGPRSPFHLFYNGMLIAADGEVRLRQDIAEALVLQHPGAFPGFRAV